MVKTIKSWFERRPISVGIAGVAIGVLNCYLACYWMSLVFAYAVAWWCIPTVILTCIFGLGAVVQVVLCAGMAGLQVLMLWESS